MKKKLLISFGVVILLASGLGGMALGQGSDGCTKYEVTITNLTKGQTLSPAVVFTHNDEFGPLFELGQPASEELARVAEDANTTALVDALEGDETVNEVVVMEGPIPPGGTASVQVSASEQFPRISLVSMLVTTNDAFMSLRSAQALRVGNASYAAPAYDAGTEFNNENCTFIPGPPCGNAGVRDTQNAEGYIYIHSGIHGIGDLAPAEFDWRNPVALITIRCIGQ